METRIEKGKKAGWKLEIIKGIKEVKRTEVYEREQKNLENILRKLIAFSLELSDRSI